MDSRNFELIQKESVIETSGDCVVDFTKLNVLQRNIQSKIIISENIQSKIVFLLKYIDCSNLKIVFELKENSILHLGCFIENSNKIDINFDFLLNGKCAQVDCRIGVCCNDNDKINLCFNQVHKFSDTSSNIFCKSSLDGTAKLKFCGEINIPNHSMNCNARHCCSNLLLSKSAISEGKPCLKICSKNVNCSHGFSSSGINDIDVFYMKSRGIKYENSVKLLSDGFVFSVFDKIFENDLGIC